ncbi:alpha/beta-Hydrolase [Glarea lozoyensis ATCC 20868]|uniref:Alpha/beta-Hydrolase n=1 Tax=Glarea lozoyensis (strain ATCC 20868 / MF5171) TaxID=1116229 RepID=S3DGM0_GLAL2|nr:alpha/beta-Hydrolase [Glarea lozoyensis ATCC 20868]EPE31181.1 alpha/beta-Hydrolase [Glarea lozoyensis ATCC 20868]
MSTIDSHDLNGTTLRRDSTQILSGKYHIYITLALDNISFSIAPRLLFLSATFAMAQATEQSSSCKINLNPDTTDIKYTSYANLVRSVQLRSGHTYRYVFKAPFNSSLPTLLFLHGWPETSYSWVNQIEYFTRHGYGIIAPDMIGTGGTDNPNDLESFTFKRTASEMDELLECEELDQVIGIGHNIGSALLSRLQHYHPNRLSALVFLTLGYSVPGADLTRDFVDATNEATLAAFGYPLLGYWYFNERDDAAVVTDKHLDALYNIAYGTDITWAPNITEVGALERWLHADGRIPFQNEFLTDTTLAQWRTILQAQGGMDGPFKWYRAMMRGYNTADEQALKLSTSPIVTKRSLLIVGDNDPIAIPSIQLNNTVPYIPFLTVRTVPSRHFMQADTARDVNRHLHEFLQSLEK